MANHEQVRHPNEVIEAAKDCKSSFYRLNDAILEWITDHVLASVLLFDIALVVPLLLINAPDSIKITLGVISGSWIQWWALPALQRSQNKIQAQNDAKAEVDHETLTYLAKLQDEQMVELKNQTLILEAIKIKDEDFEKLKTSIHQAGEIRREIKKRGRPRKNAKETKD